MKEENESIKSETDKEKIMRVKKMIVGILNKEELFARQALEIIFNLLDATFVKIGKPNLTNEIIKLMAEESIMVNRNNK